MMRKQGLSAIAASVGLAVALSFAPLPAAAKDKAKLAAETYVAALKA